MTSLLYEERTHSDLADEQLGDDNLRIVVEGIEERVEVQSREQHIPHSKRKHRWYPPTRILQREAFVRHSVGLSFAPSKVMHGTRFVDLFIHLSRGKCPLLPLKDDEIIIRKETTSVPFGSNGRTKYDHVLGDGAVQKRHRSHSATRIIEQPLFVSVDVTRVDLVEFNGNLLDLGSSGEIAANDILSDTMKHLGLEYIETIAILVQHSEECEHNC